MSDATCPTCGGPIIREPHPASTCVNYLSATVRRVTNERVAATATILELLTKWDHVKADVDILVASVRRELK